MIDDDIVKRLRHTHWPNIPDMMDAADEIERLRAELAAERERREKTDRDAFEAVKDLVAALSNVAKLREALEFYANERTYQSSTVYMCGHSGCSKIETDGGRRARAVLKETK